MTLFDRRLITLLTSCSSVVLSTVLSFSLCQESTDLN